MANSLDIITGALRHLGIVAAEAPLSAEEIRDGLEELNDMGSEWEVTGLPTGFEPTNDINKELAVPREYLGAFKSNLAVRLAPQFARAVSPALLQLATTTLNAMMTNIVFSDDEVSYPSTLPIGSGNECPDITDRRFFNPDEIRNF